MFCSNCGENLPLTAKFCCHCGTKTQASHHDKEISGITSKKPVKRVASEDSETLSDDDFMVRKATPTKERGESSEAVVKAVNTLKKMLHGRTSPATHTVDFMLHPLDAKSIQKGKIQVEIKPASSPEDWDIKLNGALKHGSGAKFYLDKTLKAECKSLAEARKMKTQKHRKAIQIYTVIPLGRAMLKQQLKGLHSVDQENKKTPSNKSAVASPPPPEGVESTPSPDNEDRQPAIKDVSPVKLGECIEENMQVISQKSPPVVVVESDEDELQVATQEDSSQDRSKGGEAASQIDVDGAEEDSHEMMQFVQLQKKLIERQRDAEARQDKPMGVPLKYILIFYVARDKKGYLVPTYDGDKITDIYDRIVAQIPPEILAPKFFLQTESGDTIGIDWKGEVATLSHVKLIEEQHDMNDTITNFDDVVW